MAKFKSYCSYFCSLNFKLLSCNNISFCGFKTESPVLRKEESGSQSMDTHTSTWFWSQMLVELEMYILCPSRDQRLDGKLCLGTGGRIGKAITISMVKASHSKSLQVMVELSLATTLCLAIGNLDRHLQGDNFRNISSISS